MMNYFQAKNPGASTGGGQKMDVEDDHDFVAQKPWIEK